MKKTILLLAGLGLLTMSCSDDDNSGTTGGNVTAYLPLAEGNFWVYDVESTVMNGRDSLYVANDTVIGSNTFKKIKTGALPTGFFAGALRNNGVRSADGKLFLSGTATVNFTEDLPFSVAVSNFVMFDEDAANNEVIDTESGTIEQEIEGYDVEMNYTLTARAKSELASHTVNGETYNNVKPVEMILNVEVIVNYPFEGFIIPVTIIEAQDVVVSTQYYAEGIGAIHAVADFQYQMAEVPNVEVPLPESGDEHQEEILVNYSVD